MQIEHDILIAMSGGVDSGVCAAIAADSGVDCCGATMVLFDNELIGRPIHSSCCSIDDVDDAKSVCHRMGIPHYTLNCKNEFREHVVDPFVASYLAGSTPNPCIACNRYLKFDTLIRKAKTIGYSLIATGHYANIEKTRAIKGRMASRSLNQYVLKRGLDEKKDQSYVLHTLTQEQMTHVTFPIGTLDKTTTRQIADYFDLVVAEKKESQDICFVENGSVDNFIAHYLKTQGKDAVSKRKGQFVSTTGEVLGEFEDASAFTIGQRKGLNLAVGHPVYVTEIDMINNVVVIGEKEDLIREEVKAGDFNWISIAPKVGETIQCTAKIRYNMKDVACSAHIDSQCEVTAIFPDGVSAPAKGQSLVLYDGDLVLGGGYIK